MELLRDRSHAGILLAEILCAKNLGRNICVLALPRGGVPVAWEIARRLQCSLDLLFVKKISAPHNEELAIGAISESGPEWRQDIIDYLRISAKQLKERAQLKRKELRDQLTRWRKGRNPVSVKGKTAVVVDDGLATGATMVAALKFLREKKPKKIIVAVPVASRRAMDAIANLCDEQLILNTPKSFFSVG